MWETIRYDVDGHVATITLDRPEKLNAFNTKMAEELWAVFDETDGDDNVRAIIVTGEGPGFCAGSGPGSRREVVRLRLDRCVRPGPRRRQPVIEPMEERRIDSLDAYARGRSSDAKEGIINFVEKREPDYRDRVSSDIPQRFPWWKEAEWE